MSGIATRLRALVVADDGQDLIEYALLAALIAVGAIGAMQGLATVIDEVLWKKGVVEKLNGV